MKLTQVDFHMNLTKLFLIFLHMSLLCKGLRFFIPPKRIEYADFLTQFELLYRGTIIFEIKFANHDFLKTKLKDTCFSTSPKKNYQKRIL